MLPSLSENCKKVGSWSNIVGLVLCGMDSKELCRLGLDLPEPWYVEDVYMEKGDQDFILHVNISHRRAVKFEYEGESYSVYDHHERTWRHLNFFQHECYLHARVPRVKLPGGEVKLVQVPWAKPGSSFTLLFDLQVMDLVREGMSASAAGRQMQIGARRVFRILRTYVTNALATQSIAPIKNLSVDETSTRKGHNYFTILADHDAKKVVGVSEGKDKQACAQALTDMEVRGAPPEYVRTVTMDMSRSYISAAAQYLQNADIVFDRFHIIKQMNEAVDKIRKADRRSYSELKGSRYLWLKNKSKLSAKQLERLEDLSNTCPNIGEAYRLKEMLKLVLDDACVKRKVTPLNNWINEAWNSGLAPIRAFVEMLHRHWYGVKMYFYKLKTNAIAERINLKIQEIKRVAKGFRNLDNFRIMIYFHLGGLHLKPTVNG